MGLEHSPTRLEDKQAVEVSVDTLMGAAAVKKKTFQRRELGMGCDSPEKIVTPAGEKSDLAYVNHSLGMENVSQTLAIQSLLSQFGNPQVRADFVSGKFDFPGYPERLSALDDLRWTLFPRWSGTSLSCPGVSFDHSVYHLRNLLAKSSQVAEISDGENCIQFTYAKWYELLEQVASDSYWKATPAVRRCTHFEPQVKDDTAKERKWQFMESAKPKCHQPWMKLQPRESKSRKVEEITLISSSEDESSSMSSSDESGSASATDGSDRKKKYGFRKGKADKREVVVPPPFILDGRTKLKDYLVMYENYFNSKFRGNSYDMCQHLENFLQGELLEVYRVYGGRLVKYREMKGKLLSFYRTLKVGGKSYWKSQLLSSTLNSGEALDLYGMRILGIAELAFPQSKKECATQVRRKFLDSIPRTISTRILDAERAMKAFSGGKAKYLSFASMMEMAKELQEECPPVQTVMWSEKRTDVKSRECSPSPPVRHPGVQHRRGWGTGTREYSPKKRVNNEFSSNHAKFYCSFCGRKNHKVENCWRANHLCLICGDQHFMKDCPQFQSNFKAEGTAVSNPKASAPWGGN